MASVQLEPVQLTFAPFPPGDIVTVVKAAGMIGVMKHQYGNGDAIVNLDMIGDTYLPNGTYTIFGQYPLKPPGLATLPPDNRSHVGAGQVPNGSLPKKL